LTHPGTLTDGPLKRLKAQWQDDYAGASNAGKTLVLEEGMDWKQIGLTNEDAQYLETRKFQRSEIASIYRIPPHLIGDLEKSTFSNIEHQGLEFVKYTMAPWFARWEQAISRDLLTERERDRYFAEFLVDGLLRGDIKSRYDAYSVGRQWGWLSANDVRKLENMNPIDEGDEYLSPLNMIPASQIGQGTDNQGDTDGT
ncbi:MAG: phage portal protein, partial [Candidatus Competibacteraceae bacterium]|nr:phage portal protein [Candidatus Competibacteraceae bacterium]